MSKNPVPVVHIIRSLELGGAQQNTLYTVANLDRRRFEPHLVWAPGGLLDEEAMALDRVTLHPVPNMVHAIDPRQDLAAVRDIRAILAPLADRDFGK